MLFHSIEFIFIFLPVCFFAFVLIGKVFGPRASLLCLSIASVIFYGQWSLLHATMLVASVASNFAFCHLILALEKQQTLRRLTFFTAFAANLALLGYLKYSNFFIDNINAVAETNFSFVSVLIPVGVSFFTFIQIGFLVEVYNRQVKQVRFEEYFLFGTFFACITAGPLVMQRDIFPQLKNNHRNVLDPMRIAIAVSIFAIGLFKKLALADAIAPYADTVFNGVADGAIPSATLAWIGALAYTTQLYFDFSGYSDMALAIGLLFNIRLPFNFNSPLKANSITDFWRRWHMTMTRFFTNYIYSPLAITNTRKAIVGKYSPSRRFMATVAVPVIITFLVAGAWHGAGWTFIVFGLIHGIAMAVNHAWTQARMPQLPAGFAWLLTMLVVIVGLVVFRATDLTVALTMLQAMATPNLADSGWIVAGLAENVDYADAIGLITVLIAIIMMFPNIQQMFHEHGISSDSSDDPEMAPSRWLMWCPSPRWALTGALVLAIGLSLATGDTSFIYYQF